MNVDFLEISGYRSIRKLRLSAGGLNVIVGPNGTGKSNLYRSIELLQAAADGRLSQSLASEGGMPSVLWAGKRYKGPVRMSIRVGLEEFEYELQLGLPVPSESAFKLDPEVKLEQLWFKDAGSRHLMMKRDRAYGWILDQDGRRVEFSDGLTPSESLLSDIRDPVRFPILASVREQFRFWRFYHGFRTDPASPLRVPHPACRTPILSADGSDLAAALRTIEEMGDGTALHEAVEEAFPESRLRIDFPDGAGAERADRLGFYIQLKMPQFHRAFDARELSDGTLRYLCLVAALLSPREPVLMALNEPETSLHPDLLEPLAKLIHRASRRMQVWLTTHSERLAGYLEELGRVQMIRLAKDAEGGTVVCSGNKKNPD